MTAWGACRPRRAWSGRALCRGPRHKGSEVMGCAQGPGGEAQQASPQVPAQRGLDSALCEHQERNTVPTWRECPLNMTPLCLWMTCGWWPGLPGPPFHTSKVGIVGPSPPSSNFPGNPARVLVLVFVRLNKALSPLWTHSLLSPGCFHTQHRRPGTNWLRFEISSTLNLPHSLGQAALALSEPRSLSPVKPA